MIGSAGTVASAGVIGSAGTVASAGVVGSAGTVASAGRRGERRSDAERRRSRQRRHRRPGSATAAALRAWPASDASTAWAAWAASGAWDCGEQWERSAARALTSDDRCPRPFASPSSTSLRSRRDPRGQQALQNTLDLARLADRLGYHRYWVAEHHGGPMLAGPSPEALIGPIAAATTSIRVGSGGVMLPHYSPFKVAETFSLLAGLFPGRIDLALGRAAGTDPLTTFALQRDRRQAAPDDFPQQLVELLGYLDDRLPEDHPFARLAKTLPGRPERPEPWLLGSSPQSALWAAEPRAAVRVRRLHQRRRSRDHRALSRALRRTRTRRCRPRTAVARLGDLRRQRRGGPPPGRQRAYDVHAAAPRRTDRRTATGEGDSSSWPPRSARARQPRSERRAVSARRPRSAPSSRTWSPNTAPRRRSS